MTVQERTALRAVVLPAGYPIPADAPTNRLLNDLGMEVASAGSTSEAFRYLTDEPTDIFVVDVAESPENMDMVGRLPELRADRRPRNLAIFSDHRDDRLDKVRAQMTSTRVHVFLKPLHMHGLLNVLRKLQN